MASSSTAAMPPHATENNGLHTVDSDNDVKNYGTTEPRAEIDGEEAPIVQDGVLQAEAITSVMSREMMFAMFALLYLVSFTDSLLQAIQTSLSPYITSTFGKHSLLGITDVVATVVGGVCNLAIAKVIDIWGRCEGFAVMIVFILLGMVLKAACISVEMYAAANTIYWVGHIGVQYVISIMFADMTSLRNRLVLFGIQQTPIIASILGGPQIAALFNNNLNFRWAFGAFSIIMLFLAVPVGVLFILAKNKAVRAGKYPVKDSGRTAWESTKFYFVEFDVVGMFLTIFGWSLLLLPFSLVTYAPNGWQTGYIIAMIVLGLVLLAGFVIWECYFAKVTYFPFRYLTNRTILGACLLYGFMFLSIFIWDTYYYSYLLVVHDLSMPIAQYVLNTFSLTSAVISPFVGIAIHFIGTFKYPSIAVTPFAILGTALLVYFRHPGVEIGFLVMCQLFNGISSGVWALTAQLAIMSSVSHQEVAVGIALFGLFGSIGASIGQAVAGAMWVNLLPDRLTENLPEDTKDKAMEIFGDITIQLSYPMGSPVRDAIIEAYGFVQRRMVIVGACFLPCCLVCLFMWRNINIIQLEAQRGKQNKRNVL